jgi:HlyD family type I secretion membrane fusion protein
MNDAMLANADPRISEWGGSLVLATFILFFIGWSVFAPVSVASVAQGKVQVEGSRQTLQHPYGGVVETITVREGMLVHKGDVTLILADSEPRAKLEVLVNENDMLKATEIRLMAERDNTPNLFFGEDLMARASTPQLAQILDDERALMAARLKQFNLQTGVQKHKVSQLKEIVNGLNEQIKRTQEQIVLLKEETEGARTLSQSGYTPKVRVLTLDRNVSVLESERAGKIAELARQQQAINEAELEIARQERQRLSDIIGELRTTRARITELGPQIELARDVVERTNLRAPATGFVVGLSVFTEGGVIKSGERILDIVPKDAPMLVEAKLPIRDVQEVKVGQTADIQLTGMHRSTRPYLRGEVSTISADRLSDEGSTGEGYYLVKINLLDEDVERAGIVLHAGMPCDVVINTRERNFMGYLMGPLLDEISMSLKQR